MKFTAVTAGICAFVIGCGSPSSHTDITARAAESKTVPVAATPTALPNWLRGTLTAQDGTVLDFRIQKKFAWGGRATGGVAALHPTTGERFNGNYSGILPSTHGRATWSDTQGPYGSAQFHTANVHLQGRNANAIATLTGDKGTVIQLHMEILAGFTPHGIGNGQDNHGTNYQVQF